MSNARSFRTGRAGMRLAAGLACLLAAGHALAADRIVHLSSGATVANNIAAMPRITHPDNPAEQRINAALQQLDRNVLRASKSCSGGDWERSIDVPTSGPSFLSLAVTDSLFCSGTAHPETGTWSIVYNLSTGRPVDWTQLLPARLTGKLALQEQADGTKVVTLASKRLFELYMAGYRTKARDGDTAECKQALRQAADGGTGMMVWPNAREGGLTATMNLPHVVAACADAVTIPVSVLRAEHAKPVLLDALGIAPQRSNQLSGGAPQRPAQHDPQ